MPYYIRDPKGTIILTTSHMLSLQDSMGQGSSVIDSVQHRLNRRLYDGISDLSRDLLRSRAGLSFWHLSFVGVPIIRIIVFFIGVPLFWETTMFVHGLEASFAFDPLPRLQRFFHLWVCWALMRDTATSLCAAA